MIAAHEYHAHVYYGAGERLKAQDLCINASDRFDIAMGRLHDRPVGPHPTGSCQLSVPLEKLSAALHWLDANRGDLSIMVHSLSGDDLTDHTEGVFWLGVPRPLDLSVFAGQAAAE